jgi:hypothetical protein
MTTRDLKQLLDELDIDPAFYSLDGNRKNDQMILCQSYSAWIVFYRDESGHKNNEKYFPTEAEACQYLYNYFKIR